MAKKNAATTTPKVRKPRKEKTPAQLAAVTLAKGLDGIAELDVRIAKHSAAIADLQARKEALQAVHREARQLLLGSE